MNKKNKHRKINENEHDSQFEDYRVINQNHKAEYVNDKLSKSTIHIETKNLDLNKVGIDFDATSFYPSALWDGKSVFPKKLSGFAFKPDITKFM